MLLEIKKLGKYKMKTKKEIILKEMKKIYKKNNNKWNSRLEELNDCLVVISLTEDLIKNDIGNKEELKNVLTSWEKKLEKLYEKTKEYKIEEEINNNNKLKNINNNKLGIDNASFNFDNKNYKLKKRIYYNARKFITVS